MAGSWGMGSTGHDGSDVHCGDTGGGGLGTWVEWFDGEREEGRGVGGDGMTTSNTCEVMRIASLYLVRMSRGMRDWIRSGLGSWSFGGFECCTVFR